jgi:hypothetical protein
VPYRVTLAVQAAGGADSDDDAARVVLDAIDAVGEREPLRKALEHAGVDVRAIEARLRAINDEWQRHRDAAELEQWRRISREEDRRNGCALCDDCAGLTVDARSHRCHGGSRRAASRTLNRSDARP